MAPKTKRPTSAMGASASPSKKSRMDPMLAGIIATLQSADDLSEQCREMLIAMVAPCLLTRKADRHSVQQLGVTMVEEMLEKQRMKLVTAVEVAHKELSDLEGSKSDLSQRLDIVKASLEEKSAAKMAAMFENEAAKTATKVAEAALAAAIEAQTKGDATYAGLEKEKAAIEAAYQEHFKAPMDANECPQYSFLKPFIDTLGLEDSLVSALPSSCLKTKEQRGGFDELVLTEFGKALVAKIAALGQNVVDAATGITAQKADVVSAEALLETKKLGEQTTTDKLKSAEEEQTEAGSEVTRASVEWSAFEPRVLEANDNHILCETMRANFEAGALKQFSTLRDTEAPTHIEEEAAVAGA